MIIAIDSDNTDLAGAIVYWRLTGDVNGDDLNNALIGAGLEQHQVSLPTPRRALRRALQEYARGEVFMRAGKQGDGGLYLVRQVPGESGPGFQVWITAHLSTGGIPKFEVTPYDIGDGTAWKSDGGATAAELTKRFWHHVWHVAATDISSWLIGQAGECDALSMRDSGGVYFIPRHALNAWKRRAECLHGETACHIYMIPALDSEDAFDAILAALIDECDAFTTAMQADIESGNFGARALEGRAQKAHALLEKLGRYETLLGTVAEGKLASVREQIEAQKANAIEAALVAGEDE